MTVKTNRVYREIRVEYYFHRRKIIAVVEIEGTIEAFKVGGHYQWSVGIRITGIHMGIIVINATQRLVIKTGSIGRDVSIYERNRESGIACTDIQSKAAEARAGRGEGDLPEMILHGFHRNGETVRLAVYRKRSSLSVVIEEDFFFGRIIGNIPVAPRAIFLRAASGNDIARRSVIFRRKIEAGCIGGEVRDIGGIGAEAEKHIVTGVASEHKIQIKLGCIGRRKTYLPELAAHRCDVNIGKATGYHGITVAVIIRKIQCCGLAAVVVIVVERKRLVGRISKTFINGDTALIGFAGDTCTCGQSIFQFKVDTCCRSFVFGRHCRRDHGNTQSKD